MIPSASFSIWKYVCSVGLNVLEAKAIGFSSSLGKTRDITAPKPGRLAQSATNIDNVKSQFIIYTKTKAEQRTIFTLSNAFLCLSTHYHLISSLIYLFIWGFMSLSTLSRSYHDG